MVNPAGNAFFHCQAGAHPNELSGSAFSYSYIFKHKTPLINKDALNKYLRKKHEMFAFIYQRFSAFYQYSALVFASLDNLFC